MFVRMIKKHAKAGLQRIGYFGAGLANVSTDYKLLEASPSAKTVDDLGNAWKDEAIPQRQRALVERELQAYRAGLVYPVFDALVGVLRHNIADLDNSSLLEIGCSSGYYSDVLKARGIHANYRGCDYSSAFVRMARQLYPEISFDVENATALSYKNAAFDIVISGCCILHIPDYQSAVSEAARVSGRWVVFHRTPVLHIKDTMTYRKKAYGVETIEIHFNEQSLIRMFQRNRLRIVDVNTHSVGWDTRVDDALAMKTYLCEKF